jgi:hypothetical protein
MANCIRSSEVISERFLSIGESFAGLLLLPEGAPVPSFVRESKLGTPIVCGIGADKGGAVATAITESFNRAEDLKEVVNFPVYTLKPMSEDFQSLGATVLKHETGEIFAISVDFQTYNDEVDNWETTVSIWAHPDFPRPFPLWSTEPLEAGAPAIVLEKVDFLPMPGIMISTAAGHVCHWIEGEILYHLIAENSASRSNVQLIVAMLTTL